MNLNIRKATIEDAKILFDWANDPVVRDNSFCQEPIAWEDHVQWLSKRIQNYPNYELYICLKDGVPVGVIRFEHSVVSVTVDPQYRGQGIGTEIIKIGCAEYIKKNPEFIPKAEIKCTNKASLKAFKKAGFVSTYVHMELSVNHK